MTKKQINHALQSKKTIIFALIVLIALITTANLTIFNKSVSNIGSSSASAQEPADINSDNKVDIVDLSILLSNWNRTGVTSDLNSDNLVGIVDLSILLSKWGDVGQPTTQTNCIVKPSDCGYPDATNTGVVDESLLTSSGSVTVTQDGAVVENLVINDGQIVVKANNVTIKNVRITGYTYYPIDNGNGNTGLIVMDTEIESTCSATTAGMSFENYTAIRVHVHGAADGFKANNNVTIQDSYVMIYG